MKVIMFNWAFQAKNLPEWFKHDEEADVTTDQMMELFSTGNNIMLTHFKDGVILFVDNKRFTQR